MKKFTLLFLPVLFANNLFSQATCNDEIIMAVKGNWTKRPDANMKGTQTTQIISRIDKIQQLLQAAYPEPRGIVAKWYRSMGGHYSSIDKNSVSYELNSMFYTWYCNIHVKKLMLGTEAGTGFNIWANKFGWFAGKVDNFFVDNKPVYLLTKKLGEFNGYLLYEGEHSGTSNTGTTYSRAFIIPREGQSPYLPVTKKQYLNAYLNGIEKRMLKQLLIEEKKPVRSDQAEADDKKKHLEYIERSTRADKIEKAKESYLRNYRTDIQRREEDLDKLKKMFEKEMKPARELLAAITEEEGLQPAIVEGNYVSGFEKFSTDQAGGRMLVRLNPDYFNSKLPTYVPQFLIVYWRWKKGEKPSEYFKDQLQANLSIDALKKMIDK